MTLPMNHVGQNDMQTWVPPGAITPQAAMMAQAHGIVAPPSVTVVASAHASPTFTHPKA